MNSDSLSTYRAWLSALVCTGVLSFALGSGVCVSAQDSAEDPVYKELIDQALNEFRHKNWPEARVLFMRAHEHNPNARTLRGMGVVSFEMRDYLNALVNLKAALDDQRQPLTEAQRRECEGLLARAHTFVGVFALKLDPTDAHVTLDGAAPTRDEQGHLLVPFGEHVLSASAPARQTASMRLAVQGGERGELALLLPSESSAASAPALAGQSDATPAARASGASAPAGQRGPQQDAPRGFGGNGLKYTWVALGASALFGGAAGLSWSLGQNKLDDLDRRCRERAGTGAACTRDNTGTDGVKRYQNLTNASIGLSAAALAAAIVLMGIEWPRERQLALGFDRDRLLLRGAF